MPEPQRWLVAVGCLGAGLVAVQAFARTYAACPAERRAAMPGDQIVLRPQTVITRAITIPAPPSQVWPWVSQMGWHRGGWYTARWVDRLFFPDNRPSADSMLAQYQHLQVGDFVPDGPPAARCGFVVREVEEPLRLVLHSTSHLPLSWRTRGRARISWTWAFVLVPTTGGRHTRLVFRWRAHTWPWWLTVGSQLLVVPADLLMSHDMLHGLRARVIATSTLAAQPNCPSSVAADDQGPSPRAPLTPSVVAKTSEVQT
jgi:hypothetical protein